MTFLYLFYVLAFAQVKVSLHQLILCSGNLLIYFDLFLNGLFIDTLQAYKNTYYHITSAQLESITIFLTQITFYNLFRLHIAILEFFTKTRHNQFYLSSLSTNRKMNKTTLLSSVLHKLRRNQQKIYVSGFYHFAYYITPRYFSPEISIAIFL